MSTHQVRTYAAWLALVTALPSGTGCGDDDGIADAGSGRDAITGETCTTASDCDDGMFCSGAETCDPSAATADSQGCVRGAPPCSSGAMCIEASQECIADCSVADRDGDGQPSIACGGLDCDDDDPGRFPGNTEICDPTNHDEDCDPDTFGFRDADGDGSPDATCCNEDGLGGLVCGDDCEDMRPGTNPDNPEVCNMRDDDCDGSIDEEVQVTLTVDADGDMFGSAAPGAATMLGCGSSAGWVIDATDCDDAAVGTHPGATELCNSIDDNCNMATDDVAGGCKCTAGMTRSCGSSVGACSIGTQRCLSVGIWGDCSGTVPTAEICNVMDDDCDGSTDEGLLIRCYPDMDNDGYARNGATATNTCPSTDAARAVAPFNNCPPLSTGTAPAASQYDCDDAAAPAVFPTACYPDSDRDGYGRNGSSVSMYVCGACPSGAANRVGDCCDTDVSSRPGAGCGGPNVCGSYDRNCSGSATTCIGPPRGSCLPGGGSGTLCLCSGGPCAGFVGGIPGCGDTGTYQQGCANIDGFCSEAYDTTPPTQTCQ